MTENKCVRCDGEGWIAATDKECRTCGGDGVTYEYDSPSHVRFVQDMQEAGIPVKHYCGRFYYVGPAVFTDTDGD
jgi:DnaJ-class molecular chaperone